MAKDLARELGYTYIDTGAMYRAVTLYCLRKGLLQGDAIDEAALKEELPHIEIAFRWNADSGKAETCLNGENVEQAIRGMEVANHVSQVAALGFVRQALVKLQQQMGQQKGIVMDGRDIGTVVFPQAEMKVYVTASPEVRAERRLKELQAKGDSTSYEAVLENVKMRDHMDMTRTESPLRQADDALVLDNSTLTIEQQKAWLLEQYNRIAAGA